MKLSPQAKSVSEAVRFSSVSFQNSCTHTVPFSQVTDSGFTHTGVHPPVLCSLTECPTHHLGYTSHSNFTLHGTTSQFCLAYHLLQFPVGSAWEYVAGLPYHRPRSYRQFVLPLIFRVYFLRGCGPLICFHSFVACSSRSS